MKSSWNMYKRIINAFIYRARKCQAGHIHAGMAEIANNGSLICWISQTKVKVLLFTAAIASRKRFADKEVKC